MDHPRAVFGRLRLSAPQKLPVRLLSDGGALLRSDCGVIKKRWNWPKSIGTAAPAASVAATCGLFHLRRGRLRMATIARVRWRFFLMRTRALLLALK